MKPTKLRRRYGRAGTPPSYEIRDVSGVVLYRTASRRLAYQKVRELALEKIPCGRGASYFLRGTTFLYLMPKGRLLARADSKYAGLDANGQFIWTAVSNAP